MVTHVFDNSNLSKEIFAIDTCRAVICSLGHGRKHMLTILPTIWRPGLKYFFGSLQLKGPRKLLVTRQDLEQTSWHFHTDLSLQKSNVMNEMLLPTLVPYCSLWHDNILHPSEPLQKIEIIRNMSIV